MGFVDMSNNNNNNKNNNSPSSQRTKSFLPSHALSLSLAGIFGDATAETPEASNMEVEEVGGEGTGGGRGGETVEISSENSGPVRSRSDDDYEAEGQVEELHGEEEGDDEDDDNANNNNNKKKKRKKYHRHTAEQIREMEALFKESPHPDEKQRQLLSKQLGLSARQVKFWFQNRRTQVKAIQERHENSLLKSEIEKLRKENKGLREIIKSAPATCPGCGFATTTTASTSTSTTSSRDNAAAMIMATEEQQLRLENSRLKAEIEKLRASVGKYTYGASPNESSSTSGSWGKDQENRKTLEFYSGFFGLEKSRVMEIGNKAVEELKKMAECGEPLWMTSVESGREILNYDEYVKEFVVENSNKTDHEHQHHHHHHPHIHHHHHPHNVTLPMKRSIEASRETGVVFLDIQRLLQGFTDVNQWKEMFPCMIAKAATVDTISPGDAVTRDGSIQLMFAELQMLTPTVATREVYFIRYCKQLSPEKWAIVDVSIDKPQENADAFVAKCKKRPSGCIIEDKSDGHCQVTWVEHLECHRSTVHAMFRGIVNSGLAFGAKHWMATLQQQCERLVFSMATNLPTKDSSGVATLAGRKSILKLAHRMTSSFCRAVGASSCNSWTKVSTKTGDDIRVASRKNLNDPGELHGVILCAVSSVWLPVSHRALFDFLRDETRRHEWDVMFNGGPAQSVASLAKGKDRGNAVTLQTMRSNCNTMWILQDSCMNSYESMVVYSPVDINEMQSAMTGCDSSSLAVLPSGFSILPDGVEQRPLVITSRPEEKSAEGGSLLTIAFQVLASNTATPKLTESIESLNSFISCTVQKIKASMQCEDA